MLDADPEELDGLWDETLARSLARSWAEPMPVRARAWLGPRLGFEWSAVGVDLRLTDWEIRTARIARARLDTGDREGAFAALHERPDRTPASPLTALEVEALSALDRPTEAVDVLELALANSAGAPAAHVLMLHLLAAETAARGGESGRAQQHGERARELAEAAGDVASKLRALEVLNRVTQDPKLARELERTFLQTPERNLRANEEAASRVVRAIGAQSNAVLRKAALTFGDLPEQALLTNDLRTWSSLFESVGRQQAGERLLASFAPRIGLPSTESDPIAFATKVLEHGRRGEALSTVLEEFGDDQAIRSESLATFGISA